jgi:hypothetical protein
MSGPESSRLWSDRTDVVETSSSVVLVAPSSTIASSVPPIASPVVWSGGVSRDCLAGSGVISSAGSDGGRLAGAGSETEDNDGPGVGR